MRPLVWFRSDLRVRDNTALHEACRRARRGVVAVFAVCPRQWRDHHDWGPMKADFVLRNVAALRDALDGLNIPLAVLTTETFDGLPEALLELAAARGCDALYFNREYEFYEQQRDREVTRRFLDAGREVAAFTDQVVFAPGSILTRAGDCYAVYGPFKKRWIARLREAGGVEVLPAPRRQPETGFDPDPVPGPGDDELSAFDLGAENATRPDLWKAGEAHARARLRAFVAGRLGGYADRRDLPAVNGTSTLSPYLAAGVLSPRQCLAAALAANRERVDSGGAGAVAWIEELIWREFYKHVLFGFPRVSKGRAFQEKTEAIAWRDDDEAFAAWCAGRTGYPIVDAGMRQLARTGWMHNRLRMIVAMFLAKHLLIDWRRGERWFMQHLVDGDLAANNGGWQWAASTGTDAQPYFRIFNPVSQSRRFDPDGAFIRELVPELAGLEAGAIHEPWREGGDRLAELGYPEPIVDHAAARARALAAFGRV